MDALVAEELPEVDDGRLVAGEERREPLARSPRRGAARSRCPDSAGRAAPRRRARRSAVVARLRPPLVDVDAGRNLVHAVDVAAHLLDDLADVRRADERRPSRARAPLSPTPRARAGRASSTRAPSRAPSRRSGAPVARPTAPPRSTWLQRTRSAGSCSRTAAAFASTQRVELARASSPGASLTS